MKKKLLLIAMVSVISLNTCAFEEPGQSAGLPSVGPAALAAAAAERQLLEWGVAAQASGGFSRTDEELLKMGNKESRSQLSAEERAHRRRLKNKKSAAKSRQKEKELHAALQAQVEQLEQQTQTLKQQLATKNEQYAVLSQEFLAERARLQQQNELLMIQLNLYQTVHGALPPH